MSHSLPINIALPPSSYDRVPITITLSLPPINRTPCCFLVIPLSVTFMLSPVTFIPCCCDTVTHYQLYTTQGIRVLKLQATERAHGCVQTPQEAGDPSLGFFSQQSHPQIARISGPTKMSSIPSLLLGLRGCLMIPDTRN